MKNYLFVFFIIIFSYSYSQQSTKSVNALRITEAPTIDGVLDEEFWQRADTAKDFVMFRPGNGDPEPITQKTEVKIAYNNEAIFFAAYLYDSKPESIMRQLSDRDNFAQADFFGVVINTYNDEQNDTEFFVSAGGTQADAKVSSANGEDFSWNDVWYSEISFDGKGWYVEMKIPYSALRFSKNKEQIWGLNFHRLVQSTREQYSWNYIEKSVGKISQYAGLLTNIEDIKTPIRLNFLPVSSTNFYNSEGVTTGEEQFGVDVRYGLTDNFTLDATFNPDFSQTGFDDLVLNLGPFETRYDEQRQFFIEGADILNKGDMFFSRRIGQQPINYNDVEDNLAANEKIIKNLENTKVLTAVKVSGRSKKGLGIAVLDAITDKSEAIIRNEVTNETRKEITEPIANYNVMVIDQEFNKNSSVTFVNTNVSRSGDFRSANASAFLFNLANKANSKSAEGYIKWNNSKDPIEGQVTGYSTGLSYDKTKGNFRFGLRHRLANETYDINDLGYQQRNNYNSFFGDISYQIFKPTKYFYTYRIRMRAGMYRRFNPSIYTGNSISLNFFATTLSQYTFGGNLNGRFGEQKDFYEPRNDIDYYVANSRLNYSAFISSDFRKKFAFNSYFGRSKRYNEKENGYSFGITPVYRASDKLFLSYSFNYDIVKSERGYVTTLDDDSIIFGIRDNKSVVNSLSGKYSFNDLASLSIVFRYNWSPVSYQSNYFKMDENGYLQPHNYSENNDVNFNSWNFDLRYVWQFTRGSELVILYRNSIFNEDDQSQLSFSNNLNNLFNQPLQQNLSIRVVYYLDYNKLKSWL
jgi:uncharacterized protein DUF5916